jgi:hypothetical protein
MFKAAFTSIKYCKVLFSAFASSKHGETGVRICLP